MGNQEKLLGRVGRTFSKSEENGGVGDSEQRFYLGVNFEGEEEKIPCPNRHCKKRICIENRFECGHSGEDSSPPTLLMPLANSSLIRAF